MIRKISKGDGISNDRRRAMMSTAGGKKLIYNIPTISYSKRSAGSITLYTVLVEFPYAVENDLTVTFQYKVTSTTSTNETVELNVASGSTSVTRSLFKRPYSLRVTGISPDKDDTYIYWE